MHVEKASYVLSAVFASVEVIIIALSDSLFCQKKLDKYTPNTSYQPSHKLFHHIFRPNDVSFWKILYIKPHFIINNYFLI